MKKNVKAKLKKITLFVPTELLEDALRVGGDNITETVRKALKLIAARETYQGLKKMRGKVKFSLTLDEMRYE
jgi:hypothetical protein